MTAADSTTRDDQVRLLLGSLFDYLPGPKTATYGAASTKPAAASEAPCTACAGTGRLGRRTPRECGNCAGKGTVAVDPYTGEQQTAARHATAEDSRRIDAELARLSREAEHRRGNHLDDRFAWEAQRQRYRRAGSYASLEEALDALRVNLPETHSLVLRCLVYGDVTPDEDAQKALDRAVGWLANRMPPTIHVPAWVASPPEVTREWGRGRNGSDASARERRNREIRELAAGGVAQGVIAERLGVSAATVSRVVSQRKAA